MENITALEDAVPPKRKHLPFSAYIPFLWFMAGLSHSNKKEDMMSALKFFPKISTVRNQAKLLLRTFDYVRTDEKLFGKRAALPQSSEVRELDYGQLQIRKMVIYAAERMKILPFFSNLQPHQIIEVEPTLRQCLEVVSREYGYADYTGLKNNCCEGDQVDRKKRCEIFISDCFRGIGAAIHFPNSKMTFATAETNNSDFEETCKTLQSADNFCGDNPYMNADLKMRILDQGYNFRWWKIARVIVPVEYRRMGVGTRALRGILDLSKDNSIMACFSRGTYDGNIEGMVKFFQKSRFSLLFRNDHEAIMVYLPQVISVRPKIAA